MSDLTKRTRQERPALHPSYEIIDVTKQRERMAREIGQQIIDGILQLDDDQPARRLKNALRQGGADGTIGADFFYDETWYDTPPPQSVVVEDLAMKIPQLQHETREEQ